MRDNGDRYLATTKSVQRSMQLFGDLGNKFAHGEFLLQEETIMEILRLLTPFDYALVVILCAVLVFSLMEGGSHKH